MNFKTLAFTLPLLAIGCASQPPASEPAKGQEVASQSCLKDTGSRIKRAGDECVDRGHVIDREEIETSGSTTTRDVIRRNVPSAY